MQERNTIPVSFDGVECQVPWTTGYNYINPTFCDLDGDGDQDLFIGSDWSRLTYLENTGNMQDIDFRYITDMLVEYPLEFFPMSQRACIPSFCDIDDDGDYDLFYGAWLDQPTWYGKLYYYENTGDSLNPIFPAQPSLYQSIESPSEMYSAFVDIDNDEDHDLFIGYGHMSPSVAGRMAFYNNEGTPEEAIMDSVTNYFEEIDLGDFCIPSFIDIDDDGDYDMFLGDEDGKIHYYRNDGTPEVYDFTFVTDEYADVNVANIASPTFTDIDGDGDYDLFVGERSWGQDDRRGDINFYENTGTPDSAVFELVTQNFLSVDIGKYNTTVFADIDNDGLQDMFIGDTDGNINYFSNTGSENNPYYIFVTETFEGIAANYQSRPCFGDLDNDGDLDILAGRASFNTGSIHLYRNGGSAEIPEYDLITSNFLDIDNEWPSPQLVDINNDGDLDLFVGHWDNQVLYFENIGTPGTFLFELADSNYLNTEWMTDFSPICFGDIDNDGDYDILRGHNDDEYTYINSYLDFYLNTGTSEVPNFVLEEEHFLDISLVKTAVPYLLDIDNDGDLDLFVGDGNGGVSFWRNNEVSVVNGRPGTGPYTFTLHQNYPNPFNAQTVIPFTLDRSLPVRIAVYNQLGQEVVTLVDERMNSGMHQAVWDALELGSGAYFVSLTAGDYQQTRKLLLVK